MPFQLTELTSQQKGLSFEVHAQGCTRTRDLGWNFDWTPTGNIDDDEYSILKAAVPTTLWILKGNPQPPYNSLHFAFCWLLQSGSTSYPTAKTFDGTLHSIIFRPFCFKLHIWIPGILHGFVLQFGQNIYHHSPDKFQFSKRQWISRRKTMPLLFCFSFSSIEHRDWPKYSHLLWWDYILRNMLLRDFIIVLTSQDIIVGTYGLLFTWAVCYYRLA